MAVKKTTGAAPKASPKAPSREEISKRAHEIFEERAKKNLPGTEEGDWLEAERQLRSKKS